MGDSEDKCPEGKAEGTNLTKCELNAFKHLSENVCKKLDSLNIDCDKLYEDIRSGDISKEQFMEKLVGAITKGDAEEIKKVREYLEEGRE